MSAPNIVVVGDGGVGKSCIICRYVRDRFTEDYEPTIEGVSETVMKLGSGKELPVKLTDTAGQEDFSSVRDLAMGQGDAFIIVFSLIEFKSLKMAEDLLERLNTDRVTRNLPFLFVLAGNKCDMASQRTVAKADAEAVASKYKGNYFETSAKTGEGVKEMCADLGEKLLAQQRKKKEDDAAADGHKHKHKSHSDAPAAEGGGGGGGGCCEVA
jgi:small GTP-binding protein